MQRDLSRQRGAAVGFTFDAPLEHEAEVLDGFLAALARGQLPPEAWANLHLAAVRDDRLGALAEAYAAAAQSKRLKAAPAAVSAEFLFRAGQFHADAASDTAGAVDFWQRARALSPAHTQAFERLETYFAESGDRKQQALLYISEAHHRPRAEQAALLRRAVLLVEHVPDSDELLTEQYQEILRLDPRDAEIRGKLESRYLEDNRPRDVAKLLEQTVAADPPPEPMVVREIRGRLIRLYAGPLGELERSMPHVEALLAEDPENDEARAVARKLVDVKALAGRAAAALAQATEATGTPADVAKMLAVELEHTRGPKRREVLRRLGILRQDRMGDPAGAYEAFEQSLALDANDDDVLRRYSSLATALHKEADAGRSLGRFAAAARDPHVRARLSTEVGQLYLAAGDMKRARTSFVAVLGVPDVPPELSLRVSRSLCAIYASERDARSLADALDRVASLEPNDDLRQIANEELAELAQSTLRDSARAITAWRRLVDTPARARALAALEPLYEATQNIAELAFVLEERSKDEPDENAQRALAFRAAEVLTAKPSERAKASAAWARYGERFGADRQALAAWLPMLEAEGDWERLALALEADASLAEPEERAGLYAKVGQIRLQRIRDVDGAIAAFANALAEDPSDAKSRAALEKLASDGSHRLPAARVLEPLCRAENDARGLLRVLAVKASLAEASEERALAIEEALSLAEGVDPDHVVDWVERGLLEGVASQGDVAPWIERLRGTEHRSEDTTRTAEILTRALGDLAIDTESLVVLARAAAEAHVTDSALAPALALYRRILVHFPSSPELIARADELLQEQGSPAERIALYRTALEQDPGPRRRRELLHIIGRIEQGDLHDVAAATATYESALADDPEDDKATAALADLYAQAERWDTLLRLLEASLGRAAPVDRRALTARMAEVAINQGDADRARHLADELLADPEISNRELVILERVADALKDPGMLRVVVAGRAARADDVAQQVAWLDRLGALELSCAEPDLAVATWKRAAAAAETIDDVARARRLYEQAREVAPSDAEVAYRLAEILERAEEWSKLPDIYAVLLEQSGLPSARIEILMRHARLLADHLDDPASGLISAAQAFELASQSTDYREVLATFTMLALRGKATHIFAQAIDDAIARNAGQDADRGARRAELRMAKARVLAANREGRDGALGAYRAILEDTDSGEVEVKGALRAFESLLSSEAADARPADRRWLFSWRAERSTGEERVLALDAWAVAEETVFGDPARALELYRSILTLDPRNVAALASAARLAIGLGDAEGAVRALESQRDQSEGATRCSVELEIASTYLRLLSRPREAMEAVKRVLAEAPADAAALALATELLGIPETEGEMAASLDVAQRENPDPVVRAHVLEALLAAKGEGEAAQEARAGWYSALTEIQRETGRADLALETVLRASVEKPEDLALWDAAEAIARELNRPQDVADAYARALALPLAPAIATSLGERGVAFNEEWFEDREGVVRILERVLSLDPHANWAFDRLKLIFDAAERWGDLFALYDRIIPAADTARRASLYEDAAQIAKDFANDSERAVGYLEKLLELRPGSAHLVASLERLYERKGAHRELVALLTAQLPSQSKAAAQRTRLRVAELWLDELQDLDRALEVAEEIAAHTTSSAAAGEPDAFAIVERVMGSAERDAAPKGEGAIPVRYRAAGLLRKRYEDQGRDRDLARALEVELEIATSAEDLIARHRGIADLYVKLGEKEAALNHVAALVLLEPAAPAYRTELAGLAEQVERFDRLADVLWQASGKVEAPGLRAELMMTAGDAWVERLSDEARGVTAYLGVLQAASTPPAKVLDAARKLEPLLERAGRSWDLLEVLERLATLEEAEAGRARAWTLAARLATTLGDRPRAITAWDRRLEVGPDDEALDALALLLEQEERWPSLIVALDRRASLPHAADERRADRIFIARIEQDKLGDLDAAIRSWERCETDFGPSDETTDALALLLEKTERWKALQEKLEEAAARAGGSERRATLHARLGEIARIRQADPGRARASYAEALSIEPKEPVARAGLLAMAEADVLRSEALETLLVAYAATDEWAAALELTPLRLEAKTAPASKVQILRESAHVSEARAEDVASAFEYDARAFLLAPEDTELQEQLERLAELTGLWSRYAEVHRLVLEAVASGDPLIESARDPLWRARFRFRLARAMDVHLGDGEGALQVLDEASQEAPAELAIALAAIDVAARLSRWPAVGRFILRTSSATGSAAEAALEAAERAAEASRAWGELAAALSLALSEGGGISHEIARDLEARLGVWHRDRREDPDAAEAAYARALTYDGDNASLLVSLAQLQRRAKGRPLVESLVRLSEATGGDLELLREAAEVSIEQLADRPLARTILESLIAFAHVRWRSTEPEADQDLEMGPVSVGTVASPAPIVRWAIGELRRIHEEDGHAERSVELLAEASKLPWDAGDSREMLHEAGRLAHHVTKDLARAIALYRGLLDSDPDDKAATAALIGLYETEKKDTELLALYARLVVRATDAAERVRVRLAAACLKGDTGDVAGAIELLQASLTDLPRHGETVNALVVAFEASKRHEELASLYVAQAELFEGAGEGEAAAAFWIRAADVAERRLSDPNRAIEYHLRAGRLVEHPGSLDDLARLLGVRGDHERAAEALRRLAAVAPQHERAPVILRLVTELVANANAPRAREALEAALADDPDEASLGARLVAMYQEEGAWDALAGWHRARAERATEKTARLSHLRTAADLFLRRCAAPEAAIPLLEEATSLDPEDRPTKLTLADAFIRGARFPDARSLLRTVIDGFSGRRPKERAVAHYHLASLEIATDNRAQALVELDLATKIDPSNAGILRALAELARDGGQLDRAERSYRALLVALKRPEESTEDAAVVRSEVLLELSAIATSQGQTDRATELLESALETASKSLAEARRLEEGLRQKKDFSTLVRALEARLARAPDDAQRIEVLVELARVLDVELGHVADAFAARQKVLALSPGSDAAHQASLGLARRVDGISRYLEEVEALAATEERDKRFEAASALILRVGRVLEHDVSDDARAVKVYERALAVALSGAPLDEGPPSSAHLRAFGARGALEAIRALDPVYLRLGRTEDRARLLARRVELESPLDDPKRAADARYGLAEILLAGPEGALEGGLLVTQALELDRDFGRAEAVVRAAVKVHPADEGLLDLFERIGRTPGHEVALLDALSLRAEMPDASADVAREAAAVAKQVGEAGRAETLLSKYVSRAADADVGWAFEELSTLREAAGDPSGAIEWKKRAVDVAGGDDARRLRFEMAMLTEDALGDTRGAAVLYEALFEDEPTDSRAMSSMLAAYRKADDAESLVRLMPRVIDHLVNDEERNTLRFECVTLLTDKLGRQDDAITLLKELVEGDPNSEAASTLLVTLLESAGRKPELLEFLARQTDAAKDRQDPKQIEALSLRRASMESAEDARATLNSALDWAPESREVLDRLVALGAEEGMEEEYLELRERLLAVSLPEGAERLALEVADARLAAGNADAALSALESGYRRDPASKALRQRLEASYTDSGDDAKLADLGAIEARSIEDPALRVARLREVAYVYARLPDRKRETEILTEAFLVAPTNVDLGIELASAQILGGDSQAAIQTLGTAIDAVTDDVQGRARLFIERASARAAVDEDQEAAGDLVAAARLLDGQVTEPFLSELERLRARAEARGDREVERTMRLELAMGLTSAGNLDAARGSVTELLRGAPKDREALRLLSRIEERAERWDAAGVAYRRLIPLEEGDLAIDTALRFADVCEQAGRPADAQGALERARTIAPEDAALRLRLERIYEAMGAFRELAELAIADAQASVDEETQSSHLKRAGALFLQDGGLPDSAIEALGRAHELSPSDMEGTLLLADAYTIASRTDEAHALILAQITARAGKRSPELASLYHRLARVAHVTGDREGELRALTSGLEADSQNGFVAAELASYALEVGDMDVATRALKSITLLKDASTSHISKGLAYQYLGEIARQQGDNKRAMLLLKRAIEDDPSLDAARALIEELRREGA